MTKIAILGATGHIAKGLIFEFLSRGGCELLLYARRPEAVRKFLAETGLSGAGIMVADFNSFGQTGCDAIVNAVGAGDPKTVASLGADILRLTERFDNMVLGYIRRHPETRYIFLSSGAVYGGDFKKPAGKNSPLRVPVNGERADAAYGSAKLTAETKHRALAENCIFDIRVFAYFSRFIDPAGDFFMAGLARAIAENKVFETSGATMVRDYAVPHDLANLIEICIGTERRNMALDLFSRAPVEKFDLLAAVGGKFGLDHSVRGDPPAADFNDRKSQYFSENHIAADLGYEPEFGSLDGVLFELSKFREMLSLTGAKK